MELKQIFQPVEKEFGKLGSVLCASLGGRDNKTILEINRFLLEAGGKKLRPAMVFLSAKAVMGGSFGRAAGRKLIELAAAVELIHRASLIHDDVIDHAMLRHSKPTINHTWGQDVAIAAGDYFYAEAFRLIAACGNAGVLDCMGLATKLMCEGELHQICERGNASLLKQHYLMMVKKKTAALFAASCQAGAMLVNAGLPVQNALKAYGANFGVAFQVRDDYLDLVGNKAELGKIPGADFNVGEWTLPIFNLLADGGDKTRILRLMRQSDRQAAFEDLRQRFMDSGALVKTREEINSYVRKAQKSIQGLKASASKESLLALADRVAV